MLHTKLFISNVQLIDLIPHISAPKKAVARRRAEPIPRRPSKRDSTDGSVRSKSDVRSKKLDSLLENSIRSKLLKVGGKGRRDSLKAVPPPPPPPPLPPVPVTPSVGRRTKLKLKRKFESKTNQRRKVRRNLLDSTSPPSNQVGSLLLICLFEKYVSASSSL